MRHARDSLFLPEVTWTATTIGPRVRNLGQPTANIVWEAGPVGLISHVPLIAVLDIGSIASTDGNYVRVWIAAAYGCGFRGITTHYVSA
jgi:hypothetical protein